MYLLLFFRICYIENHSKQQPLKILNRLSCPKQMGKWNVIWTGCLVRHCRTAGAVPNFVDKRQLEWKGNLLLYKSIYILTHPQVSAALHLRHASRADRFHFSLCVNFHQVRCVSAPSQLRNRYTGLLYLADRKSSKSQSCANLSVEKHFLLFLLTQTYKCRHKRSCDYRGNSSASRASCLPYCAMADSKHNPWGLPDGGAKPDWSCNTVEIWGHTYCPELSVVTGKMRSRTQVAKMSFFHRVPGLSLKVGVRSSDICEELGVEPLLLCVEQSQLSWFGNLIRMPPSIAGMFTFSNLANLGVHLQPFMFPDFNNYQKKFQPKQQK